MMHPKDLPNQPLPHKYLGIVDFDSAIYRCSAVYEHDEDGGLEGAKLNLLSFVQSNIVNACGCDKYLFIVTGPENFRRDVGVSKPYKGQRQADKPIHYLGLLEWAIEKYNCIISEGMEADDYAVNCHQKYQGHSVLIGMDKDNLQSAGWHYNFVSKVSKFISQEQAQWSLAFQMLRGDPGDNIPGLPRIGEVKALKFLEESSHLPPMQVVYNVYKDLGLLGAYYEEQYALLYMLRDTPVDFESCFIELAVTSDFEAVEDGFIGDDAEVVL